MPDHNICEHCNCYLAISDRNCPYCMQPMILDSRGAVSLWRLGDIRDGVVGAVAHTIHSVFGVPVVVQPAFIDERPSQREGWRGISATIFLNQVLARYRRGCVTGLGITEYNIVPGEAYNFLFGYAYMDQPAAAVSLHALETDGPDLELLAERAAKIAVHELGHTLNLDHHDYESDCDCVMIGDEKVDSVDGIDEGSANFCADCAAVIEKRLNTLR